MFSTNGYDVCYNGNIFVAVGTGSANSIAYSSNGTSWTGLGKTIFSTGGYSIFWNQTLFVASGQGTNSIAYSYNGTIWTGLGLTIFSTLGNCVRTNLSIGFPSSGGSFVSNNIDLTYEQSVNNTNLSMSVFAKNL